MPHTADQHDCTTPRLRSLSERLTAFEEILSGIAKDVHSAGELCVEIQNNIRAAHASISNIQRRLSGCSQAAQELSTDLASPEASAEDTNGEPRSTNLWKRGQDLRQ